MNTPGVFDVAQPRRAGLAPRRKAFHLLVGMTLPAVGLFPPGRLGLLVLGGLVALAITVETLRFALPRLNRSLVRWFGFLLKDRERSSVTGATYMVLSAFLVFLIFPKPVAALGLVFLTVGDPVAAIVGARARGPRVRGKSPLGTLAFFLVATTVGSAYSLLGLLPWTWAIPAGAAVAAIVEIIPVRADDNLVIPFLACAALVIFGA